jgi:hypothetical protein
VIANDHERSFAFRIFRNDWAANQLDCLPRPIELANSAP